MLLYFINNSFSTNSNSFCYLIINDWRRKALTPRWLTSFYLLIANLLQNTKLEFWRVPQIKVNPEINPSWNYFLRTVTRKWKIDVEDNQDKTASNDFIIFSSRKQLLWIKIMSNHTLQLKHLYSHSKLTVWIFFLEQLYKITFSSEMKPFLLQNLTSFKW